MRTPYRRRSNIAYVSIIVIAAIALISCSGGGGNDAPNGGETLPNSGEVGDTTNPTQQNPTESGSPATDGPSTDSNSETDQPDTGPIAASALRIVPDRWNMPNTSEYRPIAVLDTNSAGELPLTNVQWRSENVNIATVSSTGVVRSIAPGTTQIEASYDTGDVVLEASASLTVISNTALTRLRLSDAALFLSVGERRTSQLVEWTANGGEQPAQCLTWSAFFDTTVITVTRATDGAFEIGAENPGATALWFECDGLASEPTWIDVSSPRSLLPGNSRFSSAMHDSRVYAANFAIDGSVLNFADSASSEPTPLTFPLDAPGHAPTVEAPTLAIDSLNDDRPLLCYATDTEIRCGAISTDGLFASTPIASFERSLTAQERVTPELALGRDGTAWVVFRDPSRNQVRLAVSRDAARNQWTLHTLTRNGGTGPRIALTPQQQPRVALRYGTRLLYGAPGGPVYWQFEQIAGDVLASDALSLLIAPDNQVSVAYSTATEIKLATKKNLAWQDQTVMPWQTAADATLTAVYAYGAVPHILAYDNAKDKLAVLYNALDDASNAPGVWRSSYPLAESEGRYPRVHFQGAAPIGIYSRENTIAMTRWNGLFTATSISNATENASNLGVHQPLTPAPTNLAALSRPGAIDLRWTAAAVPLAEYAVYWSTQDTVSFNSGRIGDLVATTYRHEGRLNGQAYHYAISATGDLGESALSPTANATPSLTVPTGVYVSGEGNANILRWTPIDGASGYTVFWSTSGAPTISDASATVEAGLAQFTHSNIDPNASYFYAVAANDDNGIGAMSLSVLTLKPPLNPTAEVFYQDGTVELGWSASELAQNYNIYFSELPGVTKPDATRISNVQSPYIHGGLTHQTTYYYRIAAANVDGESALSTEVRATALVNLTPFTWRRSSPLLNARVAAGMVSVNGQLVTLGGVTGEGISASVEIYSPSTDRWIEGPPMPTPRREMASVSIGSKIYTLGGWADASTSRAVEVFDIASQSWRLGAPLTRARNNATAAVVDGNIYIFGGWNGEYLDLAEKYDPMTNLWTSLPNMPSKRDSLASAVIGTKIYVIGGRVNGQSVNTVDVFDTQTHTWETSKALPIGRSKFAATVINNKIYVLGGWNGTEPINRVDVYDPRRDVWDSNLVMSTPRNSHTAALLNGRIYISGGWNGTRYLNSVESLGPES